LNITRGKIHTAKKVLIYGPEGIGKSTLASKFPDPVFIDTEGSTKNLDVARFDAPSSWAMLLDEIRYVAAHPDICKTLVLDTADWAEKLCTKSVCDRYHKDGIEDFGYGKGYTYAEEAFGEMLNMLTDVLKKDVNIVVTAHAQMRKFEQPEEMGAYDRWELKLSKKAAPLVKEWADMVLFANYKTFVTKIEGKNKVQGGSRVMYTSHHPCWDAKNRYGLPDEIPMDYEQIRPIIEGGQEKAPKVIPEEPTAAKKENPAQKQMPKQIPKSKKETIEKEETGEIFTETDPDKIPAKLRQLMIRDGVSDWMLQMAVSHNNYYPESTKITGYDPQFIEDVLIDAWDQVAAKAKELKDDIEIPFD
jgi:GTPase SAR1 family protein